MKKANSQPGPILLEAPLPHNLEAERSILGAVLLDGAALEVAAENLRPEDFFLEQHARIFGRMLEMSGARQAIDTLTLCDALRQHGEMVEDGGEIFIGNLLDGVPRVSHVAHYAKIVREKALLRNLVHAGHSIQQKAFGAEEPAGEILDSSLSLIDQLAMEGATERGAVLARDAIQSAQPILLRLSEGKGAILGVATGYRWLDEKLAGWVPGEYVVLAGRPSKGKTALALEFIRRQCEIGNPAVLFSKEMNRAAIIIRLACLVARIDSHKMRSGWLSKTEWERIAAALGRIGEWKLWIDDRPGMRSAEVRWRLRSLAKRHGIKLAVADYLQIFGAPGKDRFEKVTQASMDFQTAAHELGEISGGTFLVLAQLGRQADERKPQLSDLRESGQIEQDADTVLFLFDDDEKEIKPGQKEPYGKFLEVAKQRNGPCGVTTLTFIPHFMGFEPQGGEPQEHARAAAHDLPTDDEFFGAEAPAEVFSENKK